MLKWLRKTFLPPVPWPVPEGTTIVFRNVRVQQRMTIEVNDETWRSNPEWRARMTNLEYGDGRLYWREPDAKQ